LDVSGNYGIIRRRHGWPVEIFGLLRCVVFALVVFTIVIGFHIVMRIKFADVKRRDPYKRSFMHRMCYWWAKLSCFFFFRVAVVNPENLPREGDDKPYVYIANHQSFTDIFSMYFLNRTFKFVSKASIAKIPLLGASMRMAGHVLLEREDRKSQMQTIRNCIALLKNGASMVFYPEGTRSKTGHLGEFKKGAFSVARKAGVGLVPITVLGTGDIMPAGRETRLFWRRQGVKLVVHPIISAEEVQALPDDEVVAKARAAIESALPQELQAAAP